MKRVKKTSEILECSNQAKFSEMTIQFQNSLDSIDQDENTSINEIATRDTEENVYLISLDPCSIPES